jgi:TPR repeat protein
MGQFIVSRGDREHFFDLEGLRALARRGQLAPGDLVYHPLLGRRLYARELEEIREDMAIGALRGMPASGGAAPGNRAKLVLAVVTGSLGLMAVGATLATRMHRLSAAHVESQPIVSTPKTPLEPLPESDGSEADAQCRNGHAESCAALGFVYQAGKDAPRDLTRAAAYNRLACAGGDGQGCGNLALQFRLGSGVTKDLAQFRTFVQRGCDLLWAPACFDLAISYENGDMGFTKDLPRAMTLFKSACGSDHLDASPKACIYLGQMYYAGAGVAKDFTQAVHYFNEGCSGGDAPGCNNLAVMYGAGEGVAVDLVRAMALTQLACDGGDSASCNGIEPHVHYTRARSSRARAPAAPHILAMRRACDENDASQCAELGMLYEHGYWLDVDKKKADAYVTKACDLGHTVACAL